MMLYKKNATNTGNMKLVIKYHIMNFKGNTIYYIALKVYILKY